MLTPRLSPFIVLASLQILRGAAVAQPYPFQNPDLPVEQRIGNILSLMTLDEKIRCLGTDPSVPRLGIKGSRHLEGLHGLAKGGPSNWGQIDPVTTTIFPQAIGLAESWDPEVVRRVGQIEGYEARYLFQSDKYRKGALVIRAPNADIGRDPRWGRTEECYGEDAWFNGAMVVAFIRGLQGEHPPYWQTAALMKHFLANSNENGRDTTSSNFDERLLREYYSYPFWRGVVEGGCRAFMTAYNSFNGIPMTIHPILRAIAVNEWGQDGIICTDGGALGLLVTSHKSYSDLPQAAAASIKAGINQFLDGAYRKAVQGALDDGSLAEVDIDDALKGSFRVMIRLGLLDPVDRVPYSRIGVDDTAEPWLSEKHAAAAREVTQRTIVLLKNSNTTLPLDKNNIKSIAVIGPRADQVLLDWYSGTPPYTVSPLEGIRRKVGATASVTFARDNSNGEAVRLAAAAEAAIVCVGNHPYCDGAGWGECLEKSDGREAVDRRAITLEQEELIRQVYAANPKTVVVLISSFPFAINWTQEHVPAILHLTHGSQELGNALADVLFGEVNPGGRLVQTWPKAIEQLPPMMDYDIRHGRTYMYFTGEPLYPFGYGLSYTTFAYSNLQVSSANLKASGEISVSVDVKNIGDCAGDEVVQMYVKHLRSRVDRPLKELRGFKRITLQPGEQQTVSLPLKAERLAFWNEREKRFVVENDRVSILLGSSSADIRLQKPIRVVP